MNKPNAQSNRESRKRVKDSGLVSYRRNVNPDHVPELDKQLEKLRKERK